MRERKRSPALRKPPPPAAGTLPSGLVFGYPTPIGGFSVRTDGHHSKFSRRGRGARTPDGQRLICSRDGQSDKFADDLHPIRNPMFWYAGHPGRVPVRALGWLIHSIEPIFRGTKNQNLLLREHVGVGGPRHRRRIRNQSAGDSRAICKRPVFRMAPRGFSTVTYTE